MTNNNNSELHIKAEEMVQKHGERAVEIAQRKVDAFPKDEYCREKDSALMLLTEVEKLVKSS